MTHILGNIPSSTDLDTIFSGGGSGGTVPADIVLSDVVEVGNLGATHTIDFASIVNQTVVLTGTLNANCTITLTNRAAGCQATLLLKQDSTGSRTLHLSDGTTSQLLGVPTSANAQFTILAMCPDATDIYVLGVGAVASSSPQVFTQSSTATTWTITHNLGRYPVGLNVFDTTGKQLLASVQNTDNNTTVITFDSAQAGSVVYI